VSRNGARESTYLIKGGAGRYLPYRFNRIPPMSSPLTLTFRHLPRSGALEASARDVGDRLQQLNEGMTACHIVFEGTPEAAGGVPFRVKIHVSNLRKRGRQLLSVRCVLPMRTQSVSSRNSSNRTAGRTSRAANRTLRGHRPVYPAQVLRMLQNTLQTELEQASPGFAHSRTRGSSDR
jgi:hypothetical protein